MRAPMRPASMSCWMRVSRTLTSANSAAAKNALAATRRRIRKTRSSTKAIMDWVILTFGSSCRLPVVSGQFPITSIERDEPPKNRRWQASFSEAHRSNWQVGWSLDNPPDSFHLHSSKAVWITQDRVSSKKQELKQHQSRTEE